MHSTPETLKRDNAQYLWHPLAHPRDIKQNTPRIFARGEGCWVWDVDGHKLLDGLSGLWACNLGHSNRAVRDAMVAQLDELPFYSAFAGNTHVRAIELSARLVKTMEAENVSAVAFSNGGSDAVESALKIARQYWKLKGQAQRYKFISLRQGYHGVHFGGTSLNGTTAFRRMYEPLLPGCFQVDVPFTYRNPYTRNAQALGQICATQLEREIIAQGPETVAAFIAEPIQGAGGVIVPPENYWPLVRQVCDRHGVLLIADEVVTGFGRAGALFGTRLWGVNADMWCLAKGLTSGYVPMGATAIGRRVAQAFDHDTTGDGLLAHGYTYTAHPVAAAAALATLDQIEALDIPARALRQGARLMAGLEALVERYGFLGELRGRGLMVALELVADKEQRTPLPPDTDLPARLQQEAYRRGLMMRMSGSCIILSPPLVISDAEVDFLVGALEESLAAVQAGR